jgi:hypothetical protein
METQPSFNREDLLTPDAVAKILRVQRTTALNYMRRGVIPACKIGKHWYSSRPLLDVSLTSPETAIESGIKGLGTPYHAGGRGFESRRSCSSLCPPR